MNKPVAWIKQGRLGFPVLEFDVPFRYESYAIQNLPIPLYTHLVKELTDEEILEVWRENERVYPMDRSRLLDRTRACIKKASEK